MQVRRSLDDLHHMDVGHATVAAGHDPLDMAEGAVDGRGLVTMTDEGLFHGSCSETVLRGATASSRSSSLSVVTEIDGLAIKVIGGPSLA
jgi:hypothetical protein